MNGLKKILFLLILMFSPSASLLAIAFPTPPVQISQTNTNNDQQVASDGHGNGAAVWTIVKTGFNGVQISTYNAVSMQWSVPFDLSPNLETTSQPAVAEDPNGNIVVAWINNTQQVIQARVFTAATATWSGVFDLSPVDATASNPLAAMDANGNATVVWLSALSANVQSSNYDHISQTWSAAIPINTGSVQAQNLALAKAQNGNAIATWFDATSVNIQAAAYLAATNAWTFFSNISDARTPQAGLGPKVATDGDGNGFVVWGGEVPSFPPTTGIAGAVYNLSSALWSAPVVIFKPDSSVSETADSPEVAQNALGDIIVVWRESSSSGAGPIQARTYIDDLGSWSPALNNSPISISSAGATEPQVAIGTCGNGIAVWRLSGAVQAVSYDLPSDTWSATINTLSTDPGSANPQVSVSAVKDVFVIWDTTSAPFNGTVEAIVGTCLCPCVLSTILCVDPDSGPSGGGNSVTIIGTNFSDVIAVKFGTASAGFVVNSDQMITATAPPGAGVVDITVTTLNGTSPITPEDEYTYPLAAPTITNVNPNVGPIAGGTPVTLTGANFTGTSAITFGITPATSFGVKSDSEILVIAPAHTVGTVDIRVTTPRGTSAITTADQYTYVISGPAITSLNPNSGPPSGGTAVTIMGINFTGTTAVFFGTNPAAVFGVHSDNEILAIAPPGVLGTVDVRVSTPLGTSPISPADRYTYTITPAPNITGLNPNFGPVAGGNAVIIFGTNFTGASAVFFGSASATGFGVNSDNEIVAIAPAGVPGTVDVRVTTPEGTSPISSADRYTYIKPTPPQPMIPLPPSNFVGKIKKNRFINDTEYILEATWTASPSPNVVFYIIYKNGQVVDKISVNSPLIFIRKVNSQHAFEGYQITAVSSDNLQSVPATLLFKCE